MKNSVLCLLAALLAVSTAFSETSPANFDASILDISPDWYASGEARAAADNVLLYQSSMGAWHKNTNLFAPATAGEIDILNSGGRGNTIDNSGSDGSTSGVTRIMPLGDSITYDNRRKDMRPTGVRIAYRRTLHDLLKSAGYAFDFVGSEDGGDRYLGAEMDDNAGFPGITDDQLAVLISTGFAGHKSIQVTPGPYLETYPADIILLHIGTNKVDPSPDDVEDILDNIRESDPDVHIIVARIVNRYPYDEVTTTFNDNVEAMVKARADSRITMVDMENGAGIDYYTDMDDDLHPNHLGYDKMAAVWFAALEALLSTAEFSQ